MPTKASKPQPRSAGKTIKDFFTPVGSGQSKLANVALTPETAKSTKGAERNAIITSPMSTRSSTSLTVPSLASTMQTRSRSRSATLAIEPPATSGPSSRTRSATASQNGSPPQKASGTRLTSSGARQLRSIPKKLKKLASEAPPKKRKSVHDVDSDADVPDSGPITVPRTPRTTSRVAPLSATENLSRRKPNPVKSKSRKKMRLSSPDPSSRSEVATIPSSQSDELELPDADAMICDSKLGLRRVDEWRSSAYLPSPESMVQENTDLMVADESIPTTDMTDSTTASPIPTSDDGAMSTPPRILTPESQTSSLPRTPIALDVASKTAQIIADIKARAYATVHSSPETTPVVEFPDELDDSSEDDELDWKIPVRSAESYQAGPSSKANNSQSQRSVVPASSPLSSPSSSASTPPRPVRRAREALKKVPSASIQPLARKASKFNPLDVLLKEKKLANAKGSGDEAFRLAEKALLGKSRMMNEMDDEQDTSDDMEAWTNEAAALKAVGEQHGDSQLLYVEEEEVDLNGISLDEQENQRLFGEKEGRTIVDILQSEKEKKIRAKEREKALGVPLWMAEQEPSDSMSLDQVIPSLMNAGNHPILRMLNDAIERKDFGRLALFLNSGILAKLDFVQYPDIGSWMFTTALFAEESGLRTSAFQALLTLWARPTRQVPPISTADVVLCLLRCGAEPSALRILGWPCDELVFPALEVHQWENVIYNLLALIRAYYSSGQVPSETTPDIALALFRVGIDPSLSLELQGDIRKTLHFVCQHIGSGDSLNPRLETAICTRVVSYLKSLEPINQHHALAYLSAGSGRAQRIARWIAHSLILNVDSVNSNSYTELPPLSDLPACISAVEGQSGKPAGKFALVENTDYVDLEHNVQILAIAITNVDGYVALEKLAPKPLIRTPSSPSKAAERPNTVLQAVIAAIEHLHTSIVDTRAAHLDRSRAKAALKELSMRIHYQREAALHSNGTGKPRNVLTKYFPSGSKGGTSLGS